MKGLSDNIVSRVFTERKFRILRHLVLMTLTGIIMLSFLWYIPVKNVPEYYKVYAWFFYFAVFMSIIYFNLYVAVPRWLLNNKVSVYALFLFLYIVIVMISIMLVQYIILRIDLRYQINAVGIIINVSSIIFILSFLFLGTTAFLLMKQHIQSEIQKSELQSSILESELKLLKNQVNPHFLFNMLNNVNMLLKKDPKQAATTLFKLEELLRYQIQDNLKEKVCLGSEIGFLNDYLNLEKIRRDKFDYSITVDGEYEHVKIQPLLFIIFVENAVKHSNDNERSSYVRLTFLYNGKVLQFVCENSKPEKPLQVKDAGGLGLVNIKRRLALLYPDRYELQIKDVKTKHTVNLTIVL